MPTIDKSVTIPNFTEVDVQINTDEILEDMSLGDIMEHVISNYGNKETFRLMQREHDFTKGDIEEAYGESFDSDDTPQEQLRAMDDEDIIEYYRTNIKASYIDVSTMTEAQKLLVLKQILKG